MLKGIKYTIFRLSLISFCVSTKLENLLEFCVAHELLDAKSSERIACEYDRYWDSVFDIVIKCGVDEREMYKIAAKIHHLQLVTLDQLIIDTNALANVSLNNATKLSCIPYSINSSELSVVICDWWKLEVVTQSMANLTGKKIHIDLILYSDYQSLHKRLVDHDPGLN
jgi:hypothetical protein